MPLARHNRLSIFSRRRARTQELGPDSSFIRRAVRALTSVVQYLNPLGEEAESEVRGHDIDINSVSDVTDTSSSASSCGTSSPSVVVSDFDESREDPIAALARHQSQHELPTTVEASTATVLYGRNVHRASIRASTPSVIVSDFEEERGEDPLEVFARHQAQRQALEAALADESSSTAIVSYHLDGQRMETTSSGSGRNQTPPRREIRTATSAEEYNRFYGHMARRTSLQPGAGPSATRRQRLDNGECEEDYVPGTSPTVRESLSLVPAAQAFQEVNPAPGPVATPDTLTIPRRGGQLRREGAFHEHYRPYWNTGSGHEPPIVRGRAAETLPENQIWEIEWGPIPQLSDVPRRNNAQPTPRQVIDYLNGRFRLNRTAYYVALDMLFPQHGNGVAVEGEPLFAGLMFTDALRRSFPDWEGGIVPTDRLVGPSRADDAADSEADSDNEDEGEERERDAQESVLRPSSVAELHDNRQQVAASLSTSTCPTDPYASHGLPRPCSSARFSSSPCSPSLTSKKRARDVEDDCDAATGSSPSSRRRLNPTPGSNPNQPSTARRRRTLSDTELVGPSSRSSACAASPQSWPQQPHYAPSESDNEPRRSPSRSPKRSRDEMEASGAEPSGRPDENKTKRPRKD